MRCVASGVHVVRGADETRAALLPQVVSIIVGFILIVTVASIAWILFHPEVALRFLPA